MLCMNFPIAFVELIMRCIRSVSFSFFLNHGMYGSIRPSRGLRQEDPLSPFLFIICAQGFSSLLREAEREDRISGVPIIPGRLSITHLFFIDDSLIFVKASKAEAEAVKWVLKKYEEASGQRINMGKSSISFSPNTGEEDIEAVKGALGLEGDRGIQMYLGLPAYTLRQKRLQFGYLRDKVQKKLMSWNQREFSTGGKEVLLKAVVQAIPTYVMQCFKIPKSICADIDRLSVGFWWGDKEGERRLHWQRWNKMCRLKVWGDGLSRYPCF